MAIKHLNKKGIFFTFISLTLMAALIIIFTPSESLNIGADIPVIKTRIKIVNDFVIDLEDSYFKTIMRVSSHKAILALISYVEDETNGAFANLVELESSFSDVVLEGKIGGVVQPIMDDNTIKNWLDIMIDVSMKTFNINFGYIINDITITHLRPFLVNIIMDISFTVTSETASWTVNNFIVSTELSIIGFNDPFYYLNSGGVYIKEIIKTDTAFDEWDIENVIDHIDEETYVHFENSKAPTFLQRFTIDYPDTSQKDCCGIQSLVNPDNPIITDQDVSYVDYLYWTMASACDANLLFTITGIDPEFKLDFPHVVNYLLTDEDILICPPP